VRRAVFLERAATGYASFIPLRNLAVLLRNNGDYDEAARVLDESFNALERTGDARSRYGLVARLERSELAKRIGRYEDARRESMIALEICEELDETYHLAHIRYTLADIDFMLGDTQGAVVLTGLAVAEARSAGNRLLEMWSLMNRAAYMIVGGDASGAFNDAREALLLGRDRDPIVVAGSVHHLAAIAALEGELHVAARIMGFADERFKRLHNERAELEERVYAIAVNALRKALPQEVVTALMSDGALAAEQDIIRESLALRVAPNES
jgi:tetratricopeptide (TPR) repeat protein